MYSPPWLDYCQIYEEIIKGRGEFFLYYFAAYDIYAAIIELRLGIIAVLYMFVYFT